MYATKTEIDTALARLERIEKDILLMRSQHIEVLKEVAIELRRTRKILGEISKERKIFYAKVLENQLKKNKQQITNG
jgi:hypothetical protein